MTQKQLAALRRVIRREKEKIWDGAIAKMTPGLHAWKGGWLVTDGACAVLIKNKPEGLPEGDRMDAAGEMIYDEIRFGRREQEHIFCGEVTRETIATWKELRENQVIPVVRLEADGTDGGKLAGEYNAEYLLDVAETVGKGARLYIGKVGLWHWPWLCSLWVMPEDWTSGGADVMGYVLPRTQKKSQ